jgi:uncharacterized protein YbjT (DUF2867 family)
MILVTGAAGMSGMEIIREFVAQGVPVRALVRDRSKAGALAFNNRKVEIVEGDMSRPETLGRALSGIRKTLLISSANPQMLETQCTFVDACKSAGVPHVVKFSGAETGFERSKFRFSKMHAQAEEYLEQSGLAWTHLRPGGFMQVYLREARTIMERGELRLAIGDITLAPIDVVDIAKIAVAVLRAPGQEGKAYSITGPEALTGEQIAEVLSETAGLPVKYVAITPEERRREMLAAGTPTYFADALLEQSIERLRNPNATIHLEAHREFNVTPTYFADFAKRNASVFATSAAAL